MMDRTLAGESIYPDGTPILKLGDAISERFSERELEVLRLVVAGETDAAIAEKETAAAIQAGAELEAYRRAERTERVARERAEQVYHRVNGVLSDATVKVDEATSQIGGMSEEFLARLDALRAAVNSSRQALNDAARTMYALRPETEE